MKCVCGATSEPYVNSEGNSIHASCPSFTKVTIDARSIDDQWYGEGYTIDLFVCPICKTIKMDL